jgi:very-short-patch-repair endonuclease
LRRKLTPEEQILWRKLRSRRFAGYKFRRQHELGPYILDFYCDEARLSIELDGGQHASEQSKAYDRERSRYLESAGVREVRFWNSEVTRNLSGVEEFISQALKRD